MPLNKYPLSDPPMCYEWKCQRPATHIVLDPKRFHAAKYCEPHADQHVKAWAAYEAALERDRPVLSES